MAEDWVCVRVDFNKQTDGTGVYVSNFYINTPNGCGWKMENPPYNSINWTIQNVASVAGLTSGCNQTIFVSRNGPDNGNIIFTVSFRVRINLGPDHIVYFQWQLYPSGGNVLLQKGRYNA
jgi:hypothetical protein